MIIVAIVLVSKNRIEKDKKKNCLKSTDFYSATPRSNRRFEFLLDFDCFGVVQ
jgi:hypothetical protein